MIRILIFLFISSASISLYAQNSSFIPFGQAQKTVLSDLGHYERPLGKPVAKDNQIYNKLSDTREVRYSFREDMLFQIEDVRYCEDKEEAKRIEESCKAYLGLFHQAKVLDAPSGSSHYASILEDRVIEVLIENDRKSKMTKITLRSTSRLHGPRMQTEELVSLVHQESTLAN